MRTLSETILTSKRIELIVSMDRTGSQILDVNASQMRILNVRSFQILFFCNVAILNLIRNSNYICSFMENISLRDSRVSYTEYDKLGALPGYLGWF